VIRTLVAAELRHHLRDPITLAVLVLGQGMVFPLLGVGMAHLQQTAKDKADAAEVTVAVAGDLARLTPYADANTRLVARAGEAATALGEGAADATIDLSPPGAPFTAEIEFSPALRNGMTARRRATELAEAAGDAEADARFVAVGAVPPSRALVVSATDVVPPAARTLRLAASAVPALLMFLVASGGIYTALDVVTGEKERSTIETLLSTAADRRQIAVAKFLVVLLLVLTAAVVSLTSLFVTAHLPMGAALVGAGAIPGRAFAVALVLFLPLAATLAAMLTAAAARVPDFKSGQVYALPALVVPGALAAIATLPDARLTPVVALVPITNLSVALKEVLLGTARPLPLLLCLAASTVYAGVALTATTTWLGREDVLLGDRGGRHRRLRGDYVPDAVGVFTLGMALLWFVATPAQVADFAWGMALTQFGLFAPLALGAPFLLGLDIRDTLALRLPRATDVAWGITAGLLCPPIGMIVAELQKVVVPASPEVIKLMNTMVPADLPLPVLFGLVAFAPAICEELLFRGALQGLTGRSLRPAVAVALTALAFGLFHTSLFRILPTAALGLLFGTARVRSNSLLVPMLMHAMNNGLYVATSAAGLELDYSPTFFLAIPALAVVLARMGRTARVAAA
jgi:membrane protease YdiL (CAAX protease family)/ABC-type Na+ efflux pump permease subunit